MKHSTDTERATLLPCPFCGKRDSIRLTAASEMWDEESEGAFPHTDSYAVFCSASSEDALSGCGGSGGYFLTKADALSAWNRRAPAAPVQMPEPDARVKFTKRNPPDVEWFADEVRNGENLYFETKVRALLASARAVPQGWQMVPVEPTAEMICAVDKARAMSDGVNDEDAYILMLAAAPK